MKYGRYYPTNTQLANGDTLVFSGFDTAGTKIVPQVEEYDPTTAKFTTLPSVDDLPQAQMWDSYPRMFLLPSGLIFAAGQTSATWLFDQTNQVWTSTGSMVYGERHGEGAILLPNLTQVMVTGGQQIIHLVKQLPTNTTEMIDLSEPNPSWTYGTPMHNARHDHNVIQLPDQTLLAVGGVMGDSKYNIPVYQAELYNPTNATWTVMASQQGQRGYHSTAILLPDATVFSAGSDSGDSLQTYGEIYSPPYLFNGARPTITSAPTALTYGTNFTIQTPDAATISSVVLIHNDAATHADHFDQRLIPLSFTAGSRQLTATPPSNGNYAPPGYYMLFIVNSSGVPSVAPIVSLN
jgi:hypothetical protein